MVKQLYQFYGISNIDDYIKEAEEDTENDVDQNHDEPQLQGGENGDQDLEQGGTNTTLVLKGDGSGDGEEETQRSCTAVNPRNGGEESNRCDVGDDEGDGDVTNQDEHAVTSSTPISGTSLLQVSRPAASHIRSPPAKNLRKRKASFTPLAVRQPRRHHH